MREVCDVPRVGKPARSVQGQALQHELVRRFQGGDNAAADLLLMAHAGFIHQQAMKMRARLETEDAMQLAREGFVEGLRRFDPAQGGLLGYCAIWIRERIHREGHDKSRTVRLPISARKALRKDANALAEAGDKKAAERALWLTAASSLDAPIHEGEDGTHADLLAADMITAEDHVVDLGREAMMKRLVERAFSILTEREIVILRDRFMADPEVLLAEIGARFGVSRERIRQIEAGALDKIRARLRCADFASFEDWIEHAPLLLGAREITAPRATVVRRSSSRGTSVLRTEAT